MEGGLGGLLRRCGDWEGEGPGVSFARMERLRLGSDYEGGAGDMVGSRGFGELVGMMEGLRELSARMGETCWTDRGRR